MNKNNKEKLVKPDRPGGFLDYLPGDYLAREKMINSISKVFRSFGFSPIETPRVEFLKVLSSEGSDTGKNIFHIKSQEDSEPLAMPFDHTVPFARLLAANPYNAKNHSGIRLPWRRMVIGPVFRGEKPQVGRYRQFYQIDADIAGTDSMLADTEIVAMVNDTLKALGVEKFLIRINNRKILNGLAELVGIDKNDDFSDDKTKEMMRILDKIDKIGIEKVINELQLKSDKSNNSAPNLSDEAVLKIREYLTISGSNEECIEKARVIFKGIKIAEDGLSELEQILSYSKILGVSKNVIKIDFSIARGLDYYTGPVVETSLIDAPEFGSVFSGGRYDELVKRFTGEKLPAVGISIGVDRLFAALKHLGLLDVEKKSVSDVLVLRLASDKDDKYLEIVDKIRKSGANAELSLLSDTTFKNQFNFAVSLGVKYVVICGEEEFNSGKIAIKNLDKREQVEVDYDEVGDYFI